MKDNIYTIKIIDGLTPNKMIKYQEMWDKLYLNNDELTPFQSFQWNLRLIKNLIYKGNTKLAIFYKNNEPIIIFPYVIRKEFLIFRVIKFLGTGTHADYLNFIYNQKISITDFQNFWGMISKNYDKFIFNLHQINEISKVNNFMNYIKKYYIKTENECYQIPIYNNEEDYFKTLGKNTKREIKKFKNKIIKNFGKNLEFYVRITNFLEIGYINKYLKLYYNRRKIKFGKIGIDLNYDSFLKDIFKDAYKKDKIFLAVFCEEYKFYAIYLGFYSPNCKKIYLIISAIDSDFKNYNIGNILLYKTISYLCSNKHLNINFCDLTRGNEFYKKKYGGKLHKNYNFIISRYHIFILMYNHLNNFKLKLCKNKIFMRIFFKVKKLIINIKEVDENG